MKKPSFLQLTEFSVWYDDTQVIHSVSLDCYNHTTALLGPQGSGKSTLLQAMNGMLQDRADVRVAGSVLLSGENTSDMRPREWRRRVGLVLPTPSLFPMSIYENVAYGPRIHGMRDARMLAHIVNTSLANVGLPNADVMDKRAASALLPVEQKLLCIARALALNPEVLLLDEPTHQLFGADALRVEKLLERLKDQYTIVIGTSDPQQAGRVSDQTAFLLEGQLIECSPTREFFFRPRDRRTESYFSSIYVSS